MVEEALFPFFSFENEEDKKRLAILFSMHESVTLHKLVLLAKRDLGRDALPSSIKNVIDQMIPFSTSSSIYQRKGSIEKLLYFIQLLWENDCKDAYEELELIQEEFKKIRRFLSSAKEISVNSSFFLEQLESLSSFLSQFMKDLYLLIEKRGHDENILLFIQKYKEDLLAISGAADLNYLPWDSKTKSAMKEKYEARGFHRMIKQHKDLFFEMFW